MSLYTNSELLLLELALAFTKYYRLLVALQPIKTCVTCLTIIIHDGKLMNSDQCHEKACPKVSNNIV